MTAALLLGLTAALAVADWVAVARGWRKAEFLLKPGVMLALLAWFYSTTGFQGWTIWFALGMLLSLAGDVFLILPKEQFLAGFGAFWLALALYTIGFSASLPILNVTSLALAAMICLPAIQVHRQIAASLRASGQAWLVWPTIAYTFVLSLMTWSGLLTLLREDWQPAPALIASAGALSFMISDTLLGWNRFVTPSRNSRVISMLTYHLGQILIAAGVALHY